MDLTQVGATGYQPADGKPHAVLVLAHGAGAGQTHPFMTSVAHGLSARGIDVLTFDFPYMRERRKVPDKAPLLEKAFAEALTAARAWSSASKLFIGGKSMGGRMATHLAAAAIHPVSGVVVFGYPLHPPGKPDQLRVQHLPLIQVPVLVVQGERDAFGSPDELKPHLDVVNGATDLHVVRKGDHSLSVTGRRREEVFDEILDVTVEWMRRAAARP